MFRCRLSASQCFPGSPSVYCYQIAMRNVAPANTAALCGYHNKTSHELVLCWLVHGNSCAY